MPSRGVHPITTQLFVAPIRARKLSQKQQTLQKNQIAQQQLFSMSIEIAREKNVYRLHSVLFALLQILNKLFHFRLI